jgi:site-specific recombinase XerD
MSGQESSGRRQRKAPPRPVPNPPPPKSPKSRSKKAATTALVLARPTALEHVDVADDLKRADELARNAYASNTERAYRADLNDWCAYADKAGVPRFPAQPAALAAYISNMEKRGLSGATIRRRMSAIAYEHRRRGDESPLKDKHLRLVLRGHAREHTVASRGGKTPFTPETMALVLTHPKMKLRNRALLGVGIVTAIRRSNLVALTWADIQDHAKGVTVTIRRSKTDKFGAGAVKAIPYSSDPDVCPARILQKWRAANTDRKKTDLVFPVSTQTVADVVKRAVKLAGLDPENYGAHSLRAGLATAAAEANLPQSEWMGATGHKSHQVASGYARFADAFGNRTYGLMVEAIAHARRSVTSPFPDPAKVLRSRTDSLPKREPSRRGGPARAKKRPKH